MATLQSSRPTAGWYSDPSDRSQLRWWDGTRWTGYTCPFPGLSRPRRPAGASVAVWVVVIVAILALLAASLQQAWVGFGTALDGTLGETGLGGVPVPPDGDSPPNATATDLESALQGSVMIEANCGPGCVAVGGAVAISPTELVTANHVVADSNTVAAVGADGSARSAVVIARDERRDLALLRTRAHGWPVVSIRAEPPSIGEPATVVGAPGGTRRISHGTVTAVLDIEGDGVTEVQTDADVDQGNSGGPLLDSQGRLLGIVIAEHEFDDAIGWATSAADVEVFLRQAAAPQVDPFAGPESYEDMLKDMFEQYLG